MKLKLKTRVCPGCGKTETKPTRYLVGVYCSKECFVKYGAGQHLKTGRVVSCKNCGRDFYIRGAYIERNIQNCSMACSIAYNTAPIVTIKCECCGKEIIRKRKNQRFCSIVCAKIGENNPNYSDNYFRRGFNSEEKRSSLGAFKRDGYKCVACGRTNVYLHSHHKDGHHWCVSKRSDIDNIVTLCSSCHIEFHRLYGTYNNTVEQFNEWLYERNKQKGNNE